MAKRGKWKWGPKAMARSRERVIARRLAKQGVPAHQTSIWNWCPYCGGKLEVK